MITDFGFAVILAENETVRGEPFYLYLRITIIQYKLSKTFFHHLKDSYKSKHSSDIDKCFFDFDMLDETPKFKLTTLFQSYSLFIRTLKT